MDVPWAATFTVLSAKLSAARCTSSQAGLISFRALVLKFTTVVFRSDVTFCR